MWIKPDYMIAQIRATNFDFKPKFTSYFSDLMSAVMNYPSYFLKHWLAHPNLIELSLKITQFKIFKCCFR